VPTSPPQTVYVILTGASAPPGLARAAVRNGWTIHQTPPSRAQLEQALARGHSSVVIIHIPIADDVALHLIQSLKSSWRSVVIIALSSAATEQAEIQARAAGAGLFLPAAADADLIERTVLALNIQPRRTPAPARPVTKPLTHARRSSAS